MSTKVGKFSPAHFCDLAPSDTEKSAVLISDLLFVAGAIVTALYGLVMLCVIVLVMGGFFVLLIDVFVARPIVFLIADDRVVLRWRKRSNRNFVS